MSANSSIEWTDRTWNPLTGCTKVSPGCDHCYAKTMHERFNGPGSFDTVMLHHGRLDQPLHWRKPARVFVNSMSDLFHDDVPDNYIGSVFDMMARTPQHTYQILTKRHARMRSLLTRWELQAADRPYAGASFRRDDMVWSEPSTWPLPNVWLGVSVETQQWADIRIPALLDTPAAVRFLSCEPLLGPVDLGAFLWRDGGYDAFQSPGGQTWRLRASRNLLHWVIVGGESGPGARPMRPDWAQTIRDECVAAGVPFLFKQWGSHDATGKRVSKHAAGRELDGRTWDEYPERAA